MKKMKWWVVAFIAVFALFAASGSAVAGDSIVLRWAQYVPAMPEQSGGIFDQHFADEVHQKTQGKVKIEIYWANSLGTVKEMLGLVSDGMVDMATIPAGYYTSSFPVWVGPNTIPFSMKTIGEAAQAAWRLPKEVPAVEAEMKKLNLKSLYHHLLAPYHIFSSKPIRTFEDFKGLKIRSWGDHLPKALQAAGAVGVSVFPAETYESLQRGVIDGSIWPFYLGEIQRHHEVAPYVCTWNLGTFVGRGAYINIDSWNRLSPEIQQIMLTAAEGAFAMQQGKMLEWEAEAKKKLEADGATICEIPDSERQKWIDACPDFVSNWVEAAEAKGKGPEARELKKRWFEVISEK